MSSRAAKTKATCDRPVAVTLPRFVSPRAVMLDVGRQRVERGSYDRSVRLNRVR